MKLKSFLIFLAWGTGAILVFISLFIFITNIVIYVGSKSYIYKNIKDIPQDVSGAVVALIPGAAVLSNGQISPIFRDRVDKAIELYQAQKVSKILVSGDNSTIAHNEVNPVRNYLLLKGIPDQDIFLDHAGFDTYNTMYRARDIFQVSTVIIVSQSFHLPRAVFIARMLGIKSYGISADKGNILFKNYIREIFADEKAVFNLLFYTKPKYLGDVIPITGDGRNS
jgi:SanA protein